MDDIAQFFIKYFVQFRLNFVYSYSYILCYSFPKMYSHFAYHTFTFTLYLGPKVNVLHFICFHVAVSLPQITWLYSRIAIDSFVEIIIFCVICGKFTYYIIITGLNVLHFESSLS